MANCTKCGKPLKAGVKFCTSCGAAVTASASSAAKTASKPAAPAKPAAAAKPAPERVTVVGSDEVISTLGWIGTLLVLVVPIVGLVMYFVWAFGSGNQNRRNYCRASLIMTAVAIVLAIVIGLMYYSFLSSFFSYF